MLFDIACDGIQRPGRYLGPSRTLTAKKMVGDMNDINFNELTHRSNETSIIRERCLLEEFLESCIYFVTVYLFVTSNKISYYSNKKAPESGAFLLP